MTVDTTREKSVIKVTQNGKLQAVTVDRLWTVRDVSAFLGVPVGTAVSVAIRAGRTAGLPSRPVHPIRPSGRAYLAGFSGRLWRVTSSDAQTGSGGHAIGTQTIASMPGIFRAGATPSAGWHHKRSPLLVVSGSTRPSPRSRSENGHRSGSRVRSS
jgi:hypothetical protein